MAKFNVRAIQVITQDATFEVEVPDHFDGVDIDDPVSFAARAVEAQTDASPDQGHLTQFVTFEDAANEVVLQTKVISIEETE